MRRLSWMAGSPTAGRLPASLPAGRAWLLAALWSSCALGLVLFATDQRISTAAYFLLGLVQLIAVSAQLLRAYFLTGVFGGAFTAVFLMGIWIERASVLSFSAVLTQAVYTPDLIARAHNVQLMACSLFHALGLSFLPAHLPRQNSLSPNELVASRRLLSYAICLSPAVMLATLGGTSILAAQYASVEQLAGRFSFQSSGLDALGLFAVVTALVSAAWGYEVSHPVFVRTVLYLSTLVFFFRLLRGDRGGALVFFAAVGVIYYSRSQRGTLRKALILSAAATSLFVLFEIWGHVRASAYDIGLWNSIVQGWTKKVSGDFLSGDMVDPLTVTLIPQSYWHLLHCIDLHDTGTSLNGETIRALVPQAVPELVANIVGFERPLNGAWRLADYRVHGGGMYILAEGYWNYGLAGAAGVSTFFALVCVGFERWFAARSPLLTPAYFGYMGSFAPSIYYGLQPNLRMLQLAVLVAVLLKCAITRHRATDIRNSSRLPAPAWVPE